MPGISHARKILSENIMSDYFDAETFGVKPDLKPLLGAEDKRAMNILKNTTKRCGNRYESGLLWRHDDIKLPNSYEMALHRLESLERKFIKDPELAIQYQIKIKEYVEKGYARRMTEDEVQTNSNKTFYIPHFPVKNPNKQGIRLVFAAAALVKNKSLNEHLLPGPDINQPLISILFKFRQAPIAVCGDLREMFHQVIIRKEDQDCQRFLWRDSQSSEVNVYVMERMIFGSSCSPTIAQYVKNTNAERFKDKFPRAYRAVVERHYVDDYVDCLQSEQEAKEVLNQVLEIHNSGGFEMRNITSNSAAIRNHYNNDTEECVNVGGNHTEHVLGMF